MYSLGLYVVIIVSRIYHKTALILKTIFYEVLFLPKIPKKYIGCEILK